MAFINSEWDKTLRKAIVSGTFASVLSAISLAILGKYELGRTAAPVNGPSQWIWNRHAPFMNRFSWKYTGLGYVIHHMASVFWALFHEKYQDRLAAPTESRTEHQSEVLVSAIAVRTTAYMVDFYVVPQRLSPGFEQRLSKGALLVVYGVFAAGLATGTLIHRSYILRDETPKLPGTTRE